MTSLEDELQHSSKVNYNNDDIRGEPVGEHLPSVDFHLNEPLVSLEEAITPLIHLFSDLKQNVDITKRHCSEIKDNLTQNESDALYLYTNQYDLRTIINRLLRSSAERQHLIPFFKYLNLFITALSKLNSIEGVVWHDCYGEDLRIKYPIKQQFTWWGIINCKTTSNFLHNTSKERGITTLFLIECINGKSIKNYSTIDKIEDEVLLLPGSHFEVVGHMNLTEDIHVIHVKQLKSINLTIPYLSSLETMKLNDDSDIHPITTKIHTLIRQYRGKTNWWLRKQALTDEDIKELVYVLKVDATCRTLDLSYNNLSPIAAYHIATLLTTDTALKQLYLNNNHIGDEGTQRIIEVLKYQNKTLADLSLVYNQITDKSIESILEMIHINQTLTNLHLGGNQISPENRNKFGNYDTPVSRPRIDFIH